jgi:hypothetical protein
MLTKLKQTFCFRGWKKASPREGSPWLLQQPDGQ